MSHQPLLRLREALIRGFIWSFIGLIYGVLFVYVSVLSRQWELAVNPMVAAAILAATFGALIYSSMRLAVIMAALISPISVIYIILTGYDANLRYLLLVAVLTGGVVGALYGRFSQGSRVYRADAKTLAGFCAGWLTALIYLLVSPWGDNIPMWLIVGISCSLTGMFYVALVPTFIRLYDDLLPPMGDGVIVGIGVSVFVSMSFFVLISLLDHGASSPYYLLIEQIQSILAESTLGGMVGGGCTGLLSGLLLTHWQDL